MMCGGFTDGKPATEEIQSMVNGFKNQIESSLNSAFTKFQAITYHSQVVAGTNFKVVIEVDGGKHVEVKIFRPLPCNGTELELKTVNFA